MQDLVLSPLLLNKFYAPKDLQPFFNNGSLISVLRKLYPANPVVAAKLSYWCISNLQLTAEMEEEIKKIMECDTSKNCYNSYHIIDSDYIIDSQDCVESNYIWNSSKITTSNFISASKHCTNCDNIYHSTHCTSSSQIIDTTSCSNSINIINSSFIQLSSDLLSCRVIDHGGQLQYCTNCADTFFSRNCTNIKHSFFCTDINNADYQLFNQPFPESFYPMVMEQYEQYVHHACYVPVKDWPQSMYLDEHFPYSVNPMVYYNTQSEEFWEWTKTLPNYDPNILYRLTFLPRFIL